MFELLHRGKQLPQNKKGIKIINGLVLLGFVSIFIWHRYRQSTFISIQATVLFLLLPGILLTFLGRGKLLKTCGYVHEIKENKGYLLLTGFLSYLLTFLMFSSTFFALVLLSNYYFTDKQQTVKTIKILEATRTHNLKSSKDYTYVIVEYNGAEKKINYGDKDPSEIRAKALQISTEQGLFGFEIIKKRKFVEIEALIQRNLKMQR